MLATDLFLLPAILSLYLCYRLRSRIGRPLFGLVVPLLTLPLVILASYWIWYAHRPQPTLESRPLATGIQYSRIVRNDPRPIVIHVAEIDLTTPSLEVVVTPAQPTGAFDIPARKTSQFAEEFDVDLAINASFFYPFRANSPYDYYPRVGEPVNLVGSCTSNGKWYSSRFSDCTLLSFTQDNRAAIGEPAGIVWNAVSSRPVLLSDGELTVDLPDDGPQPRTAVAIDRTGTRMHWLVIDGRQPRYSEGMTFAELARECQSLDAWSAIALDGGGSSTMVYRRPNGKAEILNCPIHGRHPPGVERPVGNHLGVRVKTRPRP